jgi:hypothetical protein
MLLCAFIDNHFIKNERCNIEFKLRNKLFRNWGVEDHTQWLVAHFIQETVETIFRVIDNVLDFVEHFIEVIFAYFLADDVLFSVYFFLVMKQLPVEDELLIAWYFIAWLFAFIFLFLKRIIARFFFDETSFFNVDNFTFLHTDR